MARRAAYLLVDGRYTLQAPQQVDTTHIQVITLGDTRLRDHCAQLLPAKTRVGYDPQLLNVQQLRLLQQSTPTVTWVPLSYNVCDDVVPPPPAAPVQPAVELPLALTGRSTADKIATLAQTITQQKAQSLLIVDPTSVAWVLNIRGRDVPRLPVVLSSLLIYANGQAHWFVDAAKVPFTPSVPIVAPQALSFYFRAGDICLLDENHTNAYLAQQLQQAGAVLRHLDDPCALPRACKTPAEIAGMQAAHIRDGAALCKLFYWLAQQQPTSLTEQHIADKAEYFRQQTGCLFDLSFDTICGADANGAIVHYRVSAQTNRTLHNNTLLLLDSGAQYLDGTTDVTRTIAFGMPTPAMRRHYTLVLQGHRALTRVVWPQKSRVTGAHLDIMARQFLWQHGLDYDHGTGHGVGACLSVHEGPQGISLRAQTVLQQGMVLSNEPAFYQTDSYGIRIENVQHVVALPAPEHGEHALFGFEELTLVPYDRNLIDVTMLNAAQIADINAYHTRVYAQIAPHLTPAEAAFLAQATAPL
jgi:Xaa-Pro aminopeptidase